MLLQSKVRLHKSVLFGCCVAFAVAVFPDDITAQCCPPGTSEEVRREVQRLYEISEIDPHTRIAVPSHPDQVVETLAVALQNDSILVRHVASGVLLDVLRQTEVSREVVRERVIPALHAFLRDTSTVPNEQKEAIAEIGRLTLWCAQVHVMENERKVKSLLEAASGPDNARMQLAIDFLARIGSGEAKEGLFEAAKQKEKQGLKEAAHRLRLGAERIAIQQQVDTLGAPEQLILLKELVDDYAARKKGWGVREFVIWLIGEIERVNDPAVAGLLTDIWQNPALETDYRYAAQEALVRLGRISPEKREIVFEY